MSLKCGKKLSKEQIEALAATTIGECLRGKAIPSKMYTIHHFTVEKEKNEKLGICIKKRIITSIEPTSPFQGILNVCDIILSFEYREFSEDNAKNKEIMQKITTATKIAISIVRLFRRYIAKPDIPKEYTAQEGFEYEWVVFYVMKGITFGLDIREIDGKVYVINVEADSNAGIFSIGDCIIDVEGEVVNTCKQTHATMLKYVDKQGYMRCLIEYPNYSNEMIRLALRNKILAVTAHEVMDVPLPTDTRLYAENGIQQLKNLKKEPTAIYREPKPTKGSHQQKNNSIREKNKHIIINEQTVEIGTVIDYKTRLLVKPMPTKTVESEAMMKVESTAQPQLKNSL